jgi:hypothetical protein
MKILALVGGILALSSAPVSAAGWGAIAYDRPADSWGASWDARSPQVAEDGALRECRKQGSHCSVVVKFLNFCGAYATGSGTVGGWGTDRTRAAAEQLALRECNRRGGPCKLKVWACNSPPVQGRSAAPEWRGNAYHCRYSSGNRVPDCHE